MEIWDWLIVGVYVVVAVGIGVIFTRKAAQSTTEFFVAGRSLSWIIAGTSIVATTFSSDTPLFVAGLSRSEGVWANWFWWATAFGHMASVFFFARLWRRTNVLTEVQFVAARYEHSVQRSGLRIFKALYDGILFNCVVMASVTLAMTKIVTVIMHLSDKPLFWTPLYGPVTPATVVLVVLGGAAVLYSAMSGLYGVVYTDLFQFGLAMLGSICLAVVVYFDASKGPGLMANLAAAPDFKQALLRFTPDLSTMSLPTVTFLLYVTVVWWGAAPGSGYGVQRLLACKTERHSLLAFLWFTFCHYVVRPWPWIVVGIVSMIYFPHLADAESAFPRMIDLFLPVGLKGVMVAAMLAAFMSTLDTHLNWGTSYLINDLYCPFINRNASPRHYVAASRVCMLALTLLALLTSTKLTGILDAYKYLGVLTAGVGTVMIARWYWWRVNPWSEISALVCSLLVGNSLALLRPDVKLNGAVVENWFAVRVAINMGVTLAVWVTVTLLTSRKPCPQTIGFYRRMRIAGAGWRRLSESTGVNPLRGELLHSTIAWVTSLVFLFGMLFGLGSLVFHEWRAGTAYLAAALAGGWVLNKELRRIRLSPEGEHDDSDIMPTREDGSPITETAAPL
jgi:SSS family solute:Na+ symporter